MGVRQTRRRYYDLFSFFYDWFIKTHSGNDENRTREFLADAAAAVAPSSGARFLDLCCGTGSVILTFSKKFPDSLFCGYDFSHGMLKRLLQKDKEKQVIAVEGDAAALPFRDASFDVVTCSHAFYELKGETKTKAIAEISRVLSPTGAFLLMEHEVPERPVAKAMFYLRMAAIGAEDVSEFTGGRFTTLKKWFEKIEVSSSPSGKSRLLTCLKMHG